jgi:hypothetical protein
MSTLRRRAALAASSAILSRSPGAPLRRPRSLRTARPAAAPAPAAAAALGGESLLAGLMESIAGVAQARFGYCVVVEDSRLDIVLRHGIGARAALESLFRDSPLALEAALTQGAATLPARGARCLPVDLGPQTRAALVLYPRDDAGTIGSLETELLGALVEQLGMALSATRTQHLLARLQAAVCADVALP